jgi:predicted regulator of Ras-like GTPase activity (Roadblock/LC7/MglB family)
MAQGFLENAVAGVPTIRAIFITAMPDCLLYESWVREEHSNWAVEDVASYFGDLVRANRHGLKALGSFSSDMQTTIESADMLVVLKEITSDFVCGCVFERNAPLGMVRLHTKRLIERILTHLPSVQNEERPRGIRIMEFLDRYAPDPHAVMLRVSLRTGISVDVLKMAETLTADQIVRVEESASRLLGLNKLNL